MEAKETKRRARRRIVTLGPDLDARLDAILASRTPPPPYAALVRAMVERALPAFEIVTPVAASGPR